MSSVKEEKEDLKGGHLPAVKVSGGVRIAQHKPRRESETKEEEEIEETPNPNDEQKLIISGVPVRGNKDFPPEAIKSFHELPMPSLQQPHVTVNRHIQQPRK